MSEHEARRRAVYDHDQEESRPSGRRRRQVADWGVGEELFDHMPGRRFERRPHADIPRGDAGDGRRTIVIESSDDDLPEVAPEASVDEFASREEALRDRELHDELWAGDEPFAEAPARRGNAPFADEPTARGDGAVADERAPAGTPVEDWDEPLGRDEPAVPDAPSEQVASRTDGVVRGSQTGRRTVKIGGRPLEFHGSPARARRRPPRAMHERLGPRPDRVAMWAFALGILLILIAVATANAAVPV